MSSRPWLSERQQARQWAIDEARDRHTIEPEPAVVEPRPCTVCGALCRDVGEWPKCADCGPTDPRRWKR